MSANVGLCSTYSIFTRSGPQTKTAIRVRGVDEVGDLDARVLGLRAMLLGRLDEDGEVVQQRPLRVAGVALVELDEGAARPRRAGGPAGSKPKRVYSSAVASGSADHSAT